MLLPCSTRRRRGIPARPSRRSGVSRYVAVNVRAEPFDAEGVATTGKSYCPPCADEVSAGASVTTRSPVSGQPRRKPGLSPLQSRRSDDHCPAPVPRAATASFPSPAEGAPEPRMDCAGKPLRTSPRRRTGHSIVTVLTPIRHPCESGQPSRCPHAVRGHRASGRGDEPRARRRNLGVAAARRAAACLRTRRCRHRRQQPQVLADMPTDEHRDEVRRTCVPEEVLARELGSRDERPRGRATRTRGRRRSLLAASADSKAL